ITLPRRARSTLVPYTTLFRSLLAAWAYGESIMDLRALAAGKKVPAIKTKETWKLSLSNLLKLGTSEDAGTDSGEDDGTDYEDYRSEEHTSELQSRFDLVCRLL